MAGGFGGDHRYVDVGGGLDEAEMDVEAVGEHERLAGREVRGDIRRIEIGLDVVGDEDHHRVGGFGGFVGSENREARGCRLLTRAAFGGKADYYVQAAVAEIQGVGVTLGTVADDSYFFAFQVVDVSVFFVKASWHL